MRRPKKDIQLTSYDELLGLEETPEKSMNQVVEIDLAKLYPFNISNNQYMIPAINAFGILVLICAAECPAAIVHPIKVCMNDAASWKNDLQSERNTSDCTA